MPYKSPYTTKRAGPFRVSSTDFAAKRRIDAAKRKVAVAIAAAFRGSQARHGTYHMKRKRAQAKGRRRR